MTPIDNARPQTGARLDVLQPAIVQRSRVAAVDLLARRQRSAPLAIGAAASRRLADQRVAVLALIADDRIVRETRVDGFAAFRILRRWTLHGRDHCNEMNDRLEEESNLNYVCVC